MMADWNAVVLCWRSMYSSWIIEYVSRSFFFISFGILCIPSFASIVNELKYLLRSTSNTESEPTESVFTSVPGEKRLSVSKRSDPYSSFHHWMSMKDPLCYLQSSCLFAPVNQLDFLLGCSLICCRIEDTWTKDLVEAKTQLLGED